MTKDIFEERERAEEAVYIRSQDEKLIEKLRENARLEEIVQALAESLQARNEELLRRVMALGITGNKPLLFHGGGYQFLRET